MSAPTRLETVPERIVRVALMERDRLIEAGERPEIEDWITSVLADDPVVFVQDALYAIGQLVSGIEDVVTDQGSGVLPPPF